MRRGALPGAGRPVRRGQDVDPAHRRRPAAARARARVRCGGRAVARHGGRDRRGAGTPAAAATCSRSTRCSRTCACGRTSPTRCAALSADGAPRTRRGAAGALRRSAALADARPRTLSGGERQRVALARALARRPGRCCSTSRCPRSTRARGRAPRASWPPCCARPACPLCSSPTTSPRLRCWATRSAVVDGGRIVQRGPRLAARRRAGERLRGRLHGRRRAHRAGAPRSGRADRGGARRRRRGHRARPCRRAGRR